MATITFGRQVCGSLDAAADARMAGDRRARRLRHGHRRRACARGAITVCSSSPPSRRSAASSGWRRSIPSWSSVIAAIRLATHEWSGGAVDPAGHQLLDRFDLDDGVPRWRWSVGSVVLEAELAMVHGRSAVGVEWRLVSAGPHDRVGLEVEALCTWRDVHGERSGDGAPSVEAATDGFVFEGAYRVRGPGFVPAGEWYRGVHHREEQARGLRADEDLWFAGRFVTSLAPGERCSVEAWSGDLGVGPAAGVGASSPLGASGPGRWHRPPAPSTTSTNCSPTPPTSSSCGRRAGRPSWPGTRGSATGHATR